MWGPGARPALQERAWEGVIGNGSGRRQENFLPPKKAGTDAPPVPERRTARAATATAPGGVPVQTKFYA